MIAKLFDSHYKPVRDVPLPNGRRPEVIVLGNRVFMYYAHAAPSGMTETEHPYREIDTVYFVPGVLVTP